MASYNKTIPGSPPIDFNLSQLKDEINASGSISPICLGTNYIGGLSYITFDFDSDLSAEEETEIENIFANHSVKPSKEGIRELVVFEGQEISSNTFKRIAAYVYDGQKDRIPVDIFVLGYIDDGGTGEIRIYDKTNNIIIGSNSVTNTTEDKIQILFDENLWPTDAVVIEIQGKRVTGTGNKRLHFNSMVIGY